MSHVRRTLPGVEGAGTTGSRWVYKNNKLLMFEAEDVLVLRAWPHCAAWSRRPGQAWRGDRPRSRLVTAITHVARKGYAARRWQDFLSRQRKASKAPGDSTCTAELALLRERLVGGWTARHEAARAYLTTFPAAVLPLVLDLPERQWHMVQLLSHCPGAIELASTNRALAVALASNWAFHVPAVQRPLRAARTLLRGRRPDIAGWLGFPATRSAVSILSKVDVQALTVERLFWLRRAIGDADALKALRHLPTLTIPALRVICDDALRRSAAFSLLEELAVGPDSSARKGAPYQLRDLLEAANLLGMRSPPVARNLAELSRWHDELVAAVNRIGLGEIVGLEFPPVPVPGTEWIVPLASAREVVEEGRIMHHCVATYARRVAAGRSYLYRVLGPERATLSISRAPSDPGWTVEEISGVANRPVGCQTRIAVAAWLRASGKGCGPVYTPALSLDEVVGGDELRF